MKYVYPAIVVVLLLLAATPSLAQNTNQELTMAVAGSFDITLSPQNEDAAPAGRMLINKHYSGGMQGTGVGQMISKRTAGGAAVYSAIEEFNGTIAGKQGGFTLFHTGFMSATKQTLDITIVEGSGSGELSGISGNLTIKQENGQHYYELDYQL